ncbi:hypothetical protein FY036_19490 [Mesorhizobium microcysteis]|jgi:hypothetical protein|uniref:Pilus assembly protein PilP n=1 Tax=Neoaquamicrobium microcysteis TaxID=2682781 RepID=A0A5D4GNY3_9HYPH|nr:hypothetical protein [Mesorhizobium microcysteis]TYR30077.1 hypothetical protein FY036_19490 [Mesorhizobium microcysteis]
MARRLAPLFLCGLLATPVAAQSAGELAVGSRLAGDYSALRERPLFSPDRQPPTRFAPAETPVIEPEKPKEPVLPVASQQEAPQWQLIGVVRSERLRSALFRVYADNSVFSMRSGESRDGWTLTRVEPFEAVLDSSNARAFIRFSDGQ